MESQVFSKKVLGSDYTFVDYIKNLEIKESEICKKINEYKELRDIENEYHITDIEKQLDEQFIILEKQLIIVEKMSLNLQVDLDLLSKDKDRMAEYMEKKETIQLLNSMINGVIEEITKFEIYYNESHNRINNLLKKQQMSVQENCI